MPRGCSAFPSDRPIRTLTRRTATMSVGRAAPSVHARSAPEVEIALHPIPTPDSKPYIIVFGPDRHLWFCESGTSKIGRLNPADGSFVEFDTPTPDSRPIGITPAADGALWFCENAGNRIGRITTAGAITEFPLP